MNKMTLLLLFVLGALFSGNILCAMTIQTTIARLKRHVLIIKKYNDIGKKLYWVPLVNRPMTDLLYCDNGIEYTHGLASLCAQKIVQDGTIDSLFISWDMFLKTFNTIDPQLFLHEFAMIIFSVYKNFFIEMSACSSLERVSLVEIIDLYEHITALPIGNLLDVLDQCYDQFVDTMDQCNVQPIQNWSEWIITHWWVPPVVGAALAYTVIQAEFTHRFTSSLFKQQQA